MPLPASGAREKGERNAAGRRAQAAEGRSTIRGRLGWHAVPTLPEASEAVAPLPDAEGLRSNDA